MGPGLRKLTVEFHPVFSALSCIWNDSFRGTFRYADTAVDAKIGVDNNHIFPFVEALDRTNFNAVSIFALYAGISNGMCHILLIITIGSVRRQVLIELYKKDIMLQILRK